MLYECPLFKGMEVDEFHRLVDNRYTSQQYKAGELVALQGSLYDCLLIVSRGRVRAEMTDSDGRSAVIEEISASRVVAPAFVFATENRLPVSVVAQENTEIIRIRKSTFTKMMQENEILLIRYLTSMADRSRFLSEKLRMQRFGSIRGKMSRYLMEIFQRGKIEKSESAAFKIPHTQQQLADIFGVTRPALARCIGKMQQDGLIEVRGRMYRLLEMQKLSRLV